VSKLRIDTGDVVYNFPSGEKWVVAYVKDDYIYPLGWPESRDRTQNCKFLIKASPERRLELLNEMSISKSHLGEYARKQLEVEKEIL